MIHLPLPRIITLALLAASLNTPATGNPQPPRLRLAGGDFLPFAGQTAPAWFSAPPVGASATGRRYLVAIARGPLDALERRRIETAGGELLDYLPVHGYRLRALPGAEPALRALPFIVWLGELPAWSKAGPELAAQAAAPAKGEVKIRVVLAAGEPRERALAQFADLPSDGAPAGKGGAWRITATVPRARLAAVLSRLTALPEVEAVEAARPMRLFNQDAVWIHQSFVGPPTQQTPIFNQGIFGCGQIVGVADTGQDYDLCFFRDLVNGAPPRFTCNAAPCPVATPALNRRKDIIYYNWSNSPTGDDDTCPATITGASGHGTHTSGSIAGDNSGYANCTTFATPGRTGGDGQAPGAKLVIQEMGDDLEYLNSLNGTVWNLADVAYQNGARIHSNSWGSACYDLSGNCIPGCTMPYDSFARDADLAMWNFPDLLMIFSAGNAGEYCPAPLSIGTPAMSKSTVAVGSVGHGSNADLASLFSSPGPVFDGRLRPTLAAQGEGTVSAGSDANPGSNNCALCALDGTSMAAPTNAGLAALVREYYTAGYYAAGARNAGQGIIPTGALLKATLMNGAVPLGVPAPDPDFVSGYGLTLLGDTLAFTASPFKLRADDHREGITTGSVVPHAYDVAAGQDFIVSLAWSDYPAALNAAVARVNELKLEVTDPAGTVWHQTLGPGGSPVRTANLAGSHDTLNVEERLVFETAAPGRWIVRVRGVAVPWGPQPFALLTRGALSDCPATAAPGPLTLTTPADQQVQVSWSAVGGAAAYNLYRSYGACPGGPWVPVVTGVTGTAFLDTSVSGGVNYSYYLTAASDTAAACESPRSACNGVMPTGECTLAPFFRGAASAVSAGQSACGVTLNWAAAAPYCGSDVKYNIYRSPTAPFTPGPANRIARCVAGTAFTDSISLSNGVNYHYIVRSEDATTGHGGPCRGGNEDANLAVRSAAPDGAPVIGTWRDDAGDTGSVKFPAVAPWQVAATGGNAGPKVYKADSSDSVCADLVTPVLTLADPGQSPSLSFATHHTLEFDPDGIGLGAEGSVGTVEIATGPDFTGWTQVPLLQGYPATIDFFYNATCVAPPGDYFSGTLPGYQSYTASLLNWGGGDIRLRFHLAGESFFPGGSWWVDDVVINQAMVPGVCSLQNAGPPPIPDGATLPGTPLKAVKSGADVTVTWDAARCPAAAVNLYRGAIGSFAAFTGGNCALAPSGTTTQAIPDGSWFIIAAASGSADGSYGLTPAGAELGYTGAATACPAITQHVTNNQCP